MRPPGCNNNLFGSVAENQKFLNNMLLPSSGSASVASQRGICRYMQVQRRGFGSENHTERQGRAPAGTKNKASWNYFEIYSLLNVTISISDGMASNGRIINECRTGKDVEGNGRGLA